MPRRPRIKKRKKQKKPVRIFRNKLFFGVVVVLILVFGLVTYQQKNGKDLAGMTVQPIEPQMHYDTSKYIYKTTIDGEPCVQETNGIPYIHAGCL